MRHATITVLALAILMTSVRAAGRMVMFKADDGRMIMGLLTEAGRRPSPGVVLVGMLGHGREDWQSVAGALADANITSLALDLRAPTAPGDARALASWHTDVRAAASYLASRNDIRGLGIAGASLGATLATLAAARDDRVRSLALISPSLEYRGVRIEGALRDYGSRPAFLAASAGDPYAARSVRELAKTPPGVRATHISPVKAHGTTLLSQDEDLVRALVQWFQRTLPTS